MYAPIQVTKSILDTYYKIKPLLPRQLQLWIRRRLVQNSKHRNSWRWPILEQAGEKPSAWPGWPSDKRFAVILTHDVEHGHGVSRCKKLAHLETELGFCSSFNFVPERYEVPRELRFWLSENGFEVGVHGLKHDGKLFESKERFLERAEKINQYIEEWGAVGFRSPAMHHNLDWIGHLDIDYDLSTFDTDPFEPQSDGMATIFPFFVERDNEQRAYVEMPYTLPQDHMLFVIMQEKTIDLWKRKVDWIVEHGGMVLVNVHPDYVSFDGKCGPEEYSFKLYEELLVYIASKYSGQFWNALPYEVADYYRAQVLEPIRLTVPDASMDADQHRHIRLRNRSKSNQATASI